MKNKTGQQEGSRYRSTGGAIGLLLIGFLLACLLGGMILIAMNPFNWFVKKADGFDMRLFRQIEPGMQAADVVKLLGEPIRISDIAVYKPSDAGKQYYYYMGDPPEWLVSYTEAWIIISPDGKVVRTIINLEP